MAPSSSTPPILPSNDQYDAIVIGARLAGLTAAASLTWERAHVLVCEQAGKVGGLCNSFWRGDYLFDGGWERNPDDYARLKERCAHELIGSLEKFIPRLSRRIEICVTATPRTIASLTSNTQGAMMGWSYRRQRTLQRGNFLQMRSSVLTPIPHLMAAGHWAYSSGGSPVAVLTGKLAAEAVLKSGIKGGED